MTISSEQQELIDLLRSELAELVNTDFGGLESPDLRARNALIEDFEIHAENIGNAARMVGLQGLAGACDQLLINFQALLATTASLTPAVRILLKSWAILLQGYLQYFGENQYEQQAVSQLQDFLSDPAWPLPLSESESAELGGQFLASAITLDDDPGRVYPSELTEDMVSLAVGDDVRQELLSGLLTELPNQVDGFDRAVEQFLVTQDQAHLRIAQRIAHTLKGSANVVGIRGMASLMHYVEDLLELAEKRGTSAKLGLLLQEASDCLSGMSEYLAGIGAKPDNVVAVTQAVLDALHESQCSTSTLPEREDISRVVVVQDDEKLPGHNVIPIASPMAPAKTPPSRLTSMADPGSTPSPLLRPGRESDLRPLDAEGQRTVELSAGPTESDVGDAVGRERNGIEPDALEQNVPTLDDVYDEFGARPERDQAASVATASAAPKVEAKRTFPAAATEDAGQSAPIRDDNEVNATLTIHESQAQELLRLTGESQIGNTQLLTRIELVSSGVQSAERYQAQLHQLAADLDRVVELQTALASASGPSRDESIDPLELERYNELNSFASQLHEVTTDAHEAMVNIQDDLKALKDMVQVQRQLGFDSQDLLLKIRMLPVSVLVSRFNRCVRQAARLTNKAAILEVNGGDVLVDSRVLNALADPIMHLLRNAVDHGLEASESARQSVGKPAVGTVTLAFSRVGETLSVVCSDDGAGLDYEAIAHSAKERGLLPADLALGVSELNALILTPGFSTRSEITQTSGRGVGLDVVSDQVSRLKGTLSINSQKGKGSAFTVTAPMSILSAHTLVVQQGRVQLSIISRALEQVIYVESDRLALRGGSHYYHVADDQEPIPVFRLDEIALISGEARATEAAAMIITRNKQGERCGVLVEAVVASEEQVIKPLNQYTHKVPGVIGATILGSGDVSPVIDLYEMPALNLSDSGYLNWNARFKQRLAHLQKSQAQQRPVALVVDDSLSARRSLAQFAGDMGMEVYTAKDGFEAIQVIQQKMPSVILVDLEMPRMNGLELTSHLRGNSATKDIPIIMITSRATEKHRNMASRAGVDAYLNKPWTDEELMESIQSQLAPRKTGTD